MAKTRKDRAVLILKIGATVILLGILAFMLYKDWETTRALFIGMISSPKHIGYFVLSVLVYLGTNFTGFIVWQMAFKAMKIPARPLAVFRAYMLGMFYNNLLPTAIGGDVIKVIEMREEQVAAKHTIASVLIDRVTSAYILLLTIAAFGPFLVPALRKTEIIIAIYALAVLITLIIGITLYNETSFAFIARILRKIIPWKKAADFIITIFESFHMLKAKRRYAVVMVLFVVITQSARTISAALSGMALGFPIPLWNYFALIPIIGFAIMLPISIGGVGIREIVGGYLFSQSIPGMTFADAAPLMMTAYLAGLIANAIAGFAFFIPKRNATASSAPNAEPVEITNTKTPSE